MLPVSISLVIVSVSFCCVTNHSECSGLKWTNILSLNFVSLLGGSSDLGWLVWGCKV